MDGPVGEMIRAQKRHGYRPSHIHFLIGAPGHKEVVTALYIHNDPHIDSDTVFGVTDSLVVKVNESDPVLSSAALAEHQIRFPASDGRKGWRLGSRRRRSVANYQEAGGDCALTHLTARWVMA